jgi:hypothetical protein
VGWSSVEVEIDCWKGDYSQTMGRRGDINARWLQYGDRRGDDASAKARKLIGRELGIALTFLNGAGNGDCSAVG